MYAGLRDFWEAVYGVRCCLLSEPGGLHDMMRIGNPSWALACPLCGAEHLDLMLFEIVNEWLQSLPDAVRETALVLGKDWQGTWDELQRAAEALGGAE